MVAPRWILNEVQPIGVGDILEYRVGALGRMDTLGVIDVGAEPVTFREMVMTNARARGLQRVIVPVPVLARRLAAFAFGHRGGCAQPGLFHPRYRLTPTR